MMPGTALSSMCKYGRARRTLSAGRAFSLIELLTVVTIIAILISILVPSLNRARISAKRTASMALLHTLETGIEMFREATDKYPSSTFGPYYGDASQGNLYGAQKLARALMGREALVLKLGSVPPKDLRTAGPDGMAAKFYQSPDASQRIGPFAENLDPGTHYVATNDPTLPYQTLPGSLGQGGGSNADAPMMFIDSFRFPVLYWKANPKGDIMMAADARGADTGNRRAGSGTSPIFVQADNVGFLQWQMASKPHPMATPGLALEPDAQGPGTFAYEIHQHSNEAEGASPALQRLRKPYNANSFLLITPGPDGLYGTPDDIRNFRR